jgi:hypothetical protein
MSFLKNKKFRMIAGGIVSSATILGLFPPFYALYFDAWVRPKSLQVDWISLSTLLNDQPRASNKLRVSYDGESINNFAIVKLRIKNIGRTDIFAEDFKTPLLIKFPNIRKIFFVEVTGTKPSKFTPKLSWDDKSVKIEPQLLNSKERFFFDIGIDFDSKAGLLMVEPEGRIAGISKITVKNNYTDTQQEKYEREFKKRSDRNTFIAAMIWGLTMITIIIIGLFQIGPLRNLRQYLRLRNQS